MLIGKVESVMRDTPRCTRYVVDNHNHTVTFHFQEPITELVMTYRYAEENTHYQLTEITRTHVARELTTHGK